MRAVLYHHINGPLTLAELPDPPCPSTGAVIEVKATGVCRSDWHAWRGHDPVPLPMVPGHEFAGVVAAVGSRVRNFTVGDRVTVPFVFGCGQCEYCAAGQAQVCPQQTQPGFTQHGSFAELVAVNGADFNLVALPDSIDFVTAASLGCRFATSFRAVMVHGAPQPGDWLAVHGCGGVGLSAVMIAAALGVRVVAVDVHPAALARAAEAGAELTVDASTHTGAHQVADHIAALTGGGAHVSLDALGSVATAVASVRCLRRRGRHVQVGLLLGDQASPPLPMDRVLGWELAVHGSHGMPARDYPAMLELVSQRRLDPRSLVGRTIDLAQAPAALAALDSQAGNGMTIVIP